MSAARQRALSAVLSALAGSGLTAGIGATLPGTAFAAGPPTSTAAETTTTTPAAEPPGATGTTTTPAPTITVPTTTTTTTTTTTAETTTPTATTPQPSAPKAPAVPNATHRTNQKPTAGAPANGPNATQLSAKELGANNVALSPQAIAAEANALASTAASVQALGFYRIPLFLLPIYKAAAIQYGVPWQILAAVNEIETNFGTDLSVSSAGAVGWMQFMPGTWLQYGVDALNAGYADPYNPVDAIFAAARYLRAAGAASNLPGAILAYNHSQEYVSSVLLRAKLISSYPSSVIATLTGLVDGRLPVTGKHVAWTPLAPITLVSETATAKATRTPAAHAAATPGSAAAPAPATAAKAANPAAAPMQLDELTAAAGAHILAVQNGRVVQMGSSRKLGRYLVLRDVYGDVFTYAGLGSIAPTYIVANHTGSFTSPVVEVASKPDPAPSKAASAGVQAPQTLSAPKPKPAAHPGAGQTNGEETTEGPVSGKVRLFAHPGNPDARAAAKVDAANRAALARARRPVPLKRGSVVSAGTVLGTVAVTPGSHAGQMRFAIRPAGDPTTVDPGPVLANWSQLQAALHPQGARSEAALLGATASDVFLLSKAELQRTVLSDPGISIYACGRHDVATGAIDRRVLAVLAFLSRTGLKPTVTALHCGQSPVGPAGAASAAYQGNAVEISAINGTPISGHQGAGTITDLAIRTLLTLPSEFLPNKILSLMRYPGAPSTSSSRSYWNRLRLEFRPAAAVPVASSPSAAGAAHSAHTGKVASVPLINVASLSSDQWGQLFQRAAALPAPKVSRKPSSAAIPDPKHH